MVDTRREAARRGDGQLVFDAGYIGAAPWSPNSIRAEEAAPERPMPQGLVPKRDVLITECPDERMRLPEGTARRRPDGQLAGVDLAQLGDADVVETLVLVWH